METSGYVPPLRGAVDWCVEHAQGRTITVAMIGVVAQTAHARAAAYCSILVNNDVLAEVPGGFITGPRWAEWSATASVTRPKSGPAAAPLMDRIRRTLCQNLKAQREAKGWSQVELAKRAGVNRVYVQRAEKFCDPPPATSLVLLAEALGATVEQLCERSASFTPAR